MVVIYCKILLKVTNSLYPKSHFNPTANMQSGLGLSRVVGENNILTDFGRKATRLHLVAVIALTFISLSLLDSVLNMLCVIFKQYFLKFWDKGFTWWLYILEEMNFPIDLHIKAYHLKHWLLSLYGFEYLESILCNTFVTGVKPVSWCLLRPWSKEGVTRRQRPLTGGPSV